MAELSKQALKVENNTEFPNNNAGLITPAKLRTFNEDMIDSLVDEISYAIDSASFNQQLNALEEFTASATSLSTGSLLITASASGNVITFTKGNNTTFNVTVATGSAVDISALNTFSASALVSISNLNASSASQQVSINALNSTSASLLIETANLETFSASALISIANLNASSASQQVSINALNTNSASVNTSVTNLNSATASLFTSASSALTTASFDNGTRNLTFTKGNGTQFSVNIPDVSGSATGGATLGANTFTGSQTISLSGGEFQITNPSFPSYGTVAFGLSNASQGGIYFKQAGSILFEGSPSDSRVTFYGTGSFTKGIQVGPNEQYGNNLFLRPVNGLVGAGYPSGSAIGVSMIFGRAIDNTPTKFTAVDVTIDNDLIVTGSLTASIQNGYVWVGNSAGISTAVPTSSFGGGTIDTSSFARTNVAQTFTGNQTFNNNIIVNGTSFLSASIVNGTFTANIPTASNESQLDLFKLPTFTGANGTTYPNAYISLFDYASSGIDQTFAIEFANNTFEKYSAMYVGPSRTQFIVGTGTGYDYDVIELIDNNNNTTTAKVKADNVILQGPTQLTGSLNVSSTITASLQQGYVWVGDANGRTTTVATSSFGGGAIDTSSFAILGANQIFTGNNTFTGNTVVSQSATFGTASFNGPVVISKGINSNVQITGSLISNKISVYDFDNLFYGSQMGGTTAQGTFFGYGSTDYTQTIGAYGGGFDNELQIYANNNGIEFRDFNQSGYPAWLKLQPNSGNNPAPAFVRGLDITGSLQHSGSHRHTGETYISGNIWVSGSVNLLNEGGNGWAFSSKAMFLTNSVQTGITVESPIHFYKQTKGNMYITVNADDPGSSGSMNLQVYNNQNLNISSSATIVRGKFNNYMPTASNESQIDLFDLPTFTAANGTTYSYGAISLQDYASAGIDQTFAIEYANDSFEKYSALLVGPSRTQFIVGTGTGYDFDVIELLDNNNNTTTAKVKADTVILQGTTQLTGSLYIQSGSALPASTGSSILTWNAATGQVSQASFNTIISASVSSGEFWSTTTQSGSAGVSGSITFNNSGSFYNTSVVNGTRLQVANAGVYNIQFSAQVETSAGADTLWIWFKKNGNNISDSASKVVLANNTAQIMTVNILDQANANDYYEIAYQNLNGHATVLAEAASGNIPAIPSVIATIFQIR